MQASSGRTIGVYDQGKPGPLVYVLGGIHGNEPAGVKALQHVFAKLTASQPGMQGRFVGVCGNCTALSQQKRFIDRDMNRLWKAEDIRRISESDSVLLNSEEKEMKELLAHLNEELESHEGPHYFIDLHTTSGPRGLFSIVTDRKYNRELAEVLNVPIIFNLVGALAKTTSVFMDDRNLVGVAFESGQHDDPEAIQLHEAAIWVLLEKIGCLDATAIQDFATYQSQLMQAGQSQPPYMRVTYRHPIEPEHQFRMEPGYINFQTVSKGELLAYDRNGAIHCPSDGKILMPLYQSQGEDGFFIVEEIAQPPV
ncbi:MAG: succinylglutamate desuccinylase/aspartoacylase family protein [Bacteroidota bacterium]